MLYKNFRKRSWKHKILNNIFWATFMLTFIINSAFPKSCQETFQKVELKFNSKGEFKLVQFTDLHEHSSENKRTIKLMENILESEKPDLVVLTGDNIDDKYCLSEKDVKKAIAHIAKPMEDRKIPWAVVLGNHDSIFCKVDRKSQMKIYMSYKYNISQDFSSAPGRAGDYNILIKNSKQTKPIFNIYMLDSGSYYFGDYGYIKKQQVNWYKRLSLSLKEDYGEPIPSLMFFHIPLRNQYDVWKNGNAIGNRNEKECPQGSDTGLMSALTEMGDVEGVFVGHDHTNDYVGKLRNITLGYGRCTGCNGYGIKGFLRGARVFILNENNPREFKTYVKLE